MGLKPSYRHNKWTEAQKYEKSEVMQACVHRHDMCLVFLVVCSCIYAKLSLSGDDFYCVLYCFV